MEYKQRKLHEQQQDGGLGVVGAGGEERGRGACIAEAVRRGFPQRGSKIQSWSPERLAGALITWGGKIMWTTARVDGQREGKVVMSGKV